MKMDSQKQPPAREREREYTHHTWCASSYVAVYMPHIQCQRAVCDPWNKSVPYFL